MGWREAFMFYLDWSGSILKNKILRAIACGAVVLASFAHGSDLQAEGPFKYPKLGFTSAEFLNAMDSYLLPEMNWPDNLQDYQNIKDDYKKLLDSPKEYWDNCVDTSVSAFIGRDAETARQSAIEMCNYNAEPHFECFNEAELDSALSCVVDDIIENLNYASVH